MFLVLPGQRHIGGRATKVVARVDTNVPPADGHWLVAHLPNAEPVLVDGGHFGPRDEPEEQVLG
jgi:pimeloyl-ACP methyl ester carboxylesterase